MSRLSFRCMPAAVLAFALLSAGAFAAPTAVINASPITGDAPLGVFFDGSSSSADSASFLWQFGDGSASTAQKLTHVYNVAGTYIATLTVTDANGATNSAQITIVVTGSGQGPVTPNINSRIALTTSKFVLNAAQNNRDTLSVNAIFNTVDLPSSPSGLSASFTINGVTTNGNIVPLSGTFSGILNDEGIFISLPENAKPNVFFQVSIKDQTLGFFVKKANLAQAFAVAGIKPGINGVFPVTYSVTIGAQTYSIIENFNVTAAGVGTFDLSKRQGTIHDGFFVVSTAAAQESLDGTSHFFTINGAISKPNNQLLQGPGSGTWTFTLGAADPIVITFDRIKQSGTKLKYNQPNRDLHGIRSVSIDTIGRRFQIKTWDIPAEDNKGGTGLPVRGEPFIGFNLSLRFDASQADGTVVNFLTATRLTRKSRTDAFWQTGRRGLTQ